MGSREYPNLCVAFNRKCRQGDTPRQQPLTREASHNMNMIVCHSALFWILVTVRMTRLKSHLTHCKGPYLITIDSAFKHWDCGFLSNALLKPDDKYYYQKALFPIILTIKTLYKVDCKYSILPWKPVYQTLKHNLWLVSTKRPQLATKWVKSITYKFYLVFTKM